MPDEPLAERRFAALAGDPAPDALWQGMTKLTLRVDLTERSTGEIWAVPAAVHRMGLAASFTAEIDPNTLAAGRRLADGLWDVNVYFGVMGLGARHRASLTEERRPGPVIPEAGCRRAADNDGVYYVRTSGLCLDVGLVRHRKLALPPKPARKRSFSQRVVRRLRRLL